METTYLAFFAGFTDRQLQRARADSRRLIELGHAVDSNRALVERITAVLDSRKTPTPDTVAGARYFMGEL